MRWFLPLRRDGVFEVSSSKAFEALLKQEAERLSQALIIVWLKACEVNEISGEVSKY